MNNINPNIGLGGAIGKNVAKAPAAEAQKAVPPGQLDKSPSPKNLVNARLGEAWEKFASTKSDGKQYDAAGLKKGGAETAAAPRQAPAGSGGGGGVATRTAPEPQRPVVEKAPTPPPSDKAPKPETTTRRAESRPQAAAPRAQEGAPRAAGRQAEAGPQREPSGLRSLVQGPAQPAPETTRAAPATPGPQAQAPQGQAPQAPAMPQPTEQAPQMPQPTAMPAAMPQEASATALPQQAAAAAQPSIAPPPPDAAGRQLQGESIRNQAPPSYSSRNEATRQALLQGRTTPPPEDDASTTLAARAKQQQMSQGVAGSDLPRGPRFEKVEQKRQEEGRRCPQCSAELSGDREGPCPVCGIGVAEVAELVARHYVHRGEWLTSQTGSTARQVHRDDLPPHEIPDLGTLPGMPRKREVMKLELAS